MIFSRECNKRKCDECFENSEDCDCRCHKYDDGEDDDGEDDEENEDGELINGRFV